MSDFIKNTERIKTLYNFVYGNNSGGVDSTQNILNEVAKMTYDEFVKEAHKRHKKPDGTPKYTGYDNEENKDNWNGTRSKKKIILFCHETPTDFPEHPHGKFKVLPASHLYDESGCDVCSKNKRITKYTWLQKVIDQKGSNNTMDGKLIYKYDKVPYDIKSTDEVQIFCPIKGHGYFPQEVSKHSDGHGCPKCARDKNITKLLIFNKDTKWNTDTKETWIEKIKNSSFHKNEEGGLKYNYDDVKYENSKSGVTINCPKHGPFPQEPRQHTAGQGCPICRGSKGEEVLNDHLRKIGFGSRIPGKRFSDCVGHPSSKGACRTLPFDFYLPEQKIVIEVDGEGHFDPNYRKGHNDYTKQKQYDTIKNEFVRENKGKPLENGEIINYLIRIPYLNRNTKKVIEDFENAFEKIKENPPEGYDPIIYSDGYPDPDSDPNTKPEPALNTPEDFEKIENDKNLKENISRIRKMMGLINEYIDIPYDEKENTGSTENKPIQLIGGLKQDPPEIDKPPVWKKENNTIQLFNRDRLNFRNFIQNILPNVNLKFLGGGAIGVAFVPIGNYTLPTDFTQNNFYGVIPQGNTPVVFKFTANSSEVEKIKNLIDKPNNPGLVNYYWIKEVDLPSELQYSTTYGPSKDVLKDERRTQWIKQRLGRYWDTPEPQRKDFKLTPEEIKTGERKLNKILLRKQEEKRTKFKKLYIVCLDKINRIPPKLKQILNFCFRYYYWIQFEHKKENVKGYRNFKPISVIRSNYLNDRVMQYFYYKIVLRKDVENLTMSSNQPTYEEFVQWFPKLLLAIEKVYSVGKAKTFDLHDGNMGLDDNGNIVFFDVYV